MKNKDYLIKAYEAKRYFVELEDKEASMPAMYFDTHESCILDIDFTEKLEYESAERLRITFVHNKNVLNSTDAPKYKRLEENHTVEEQEEFKNNSYWREQIRSHPEKTQLFDNMQKRLDEIAEKYAPYIKTLAIHSDYVDRQNADFNNWNLDCLKKFTNVKVFKVINDQDEYQPDFWNNIFSNFNLSKVHTLVIINKKGVLPTSAINSIPEGIENLSISVTDFNKEQNKSLLLKLENCHSLNFVSVLPYKETKLDKDINLITFVSVLQYTETKLDKDINLITFTKEIQRIVEVHTENREKNFIYSSATFADKEEQVSEDTKHKIYTIEPKTEKSRFNREKRFKKLDLIQEEDNSWEDNLSNKRVNTGEYSHFNSKQDNKTKALVQPQDNYLIIFSGEEAVTKDNRDITNNHLISTNEKQSQNNNEEEKKVSEDDKTSNCVVQKLNRFNRVYTENKDKYANNVYNNAKALVDEAKQDQDINKAAKALVDEALQNQDINKAAKELVLLESQYNKKVSEDDKTSNCVVQKLNRFNRDYTENKDKYANNVYNNIHESSNEEDNVVSKFLKNSTPTKSMKTEEDNVNSKTPIETTTNTYTFEDLKNDAIETIESFNNRDNIEDKSHNEVNLAAKESIIENNIDMS